MSIRVVMMYQAICDSCGERPSSDYYAWSDIAGANGEAEESDYLLTEDGKHYCPKCQHWDRDDETLHGGLLKDCEECIS